MSKEPLSVNIPFEGFYNSIWSQELDEQERQEIEHFLERQKEEGVPPELRLTESEYFDILYKRSDYGAIEQSAAHAIADAYNELASEELGFALGLTWEEMTSPREYNFETDKIFMSISRDGVAKLFRMARRDGFAKLAAKIEDRHSSHSGFISFYGNELGTWLAKPVSSWDYHELGTLLRAYVPDLNENLSLYYRVCECDGLYQEWSNGVDWAAVDSDIQELREEKRRDIAAENPDYVPPAPRCPFTGDLFQGR